MLRTPRLVVWFVALAAASLGIATLFVVGPGRLGPAAAAAGPGGAPVVVLAAGDSITAASYPTHLRALFDAAGVKVRVVNAGVKGHTSGEYLAYLKQSDILRRTAPDVVCLQLGTNDVRIDGDHTETTRFVRQMETILDLMATQRSARGRPPLVFLSTIPPVVVTVPRHFAASSMRRVTEEINPAIRRLAGDRGLALVDTYDLFVRHPEWLPEIHPTEDGYHAMARQWFEALRPHVVRLAS
ncbi:MAG TPA: SGNH/GDSL hydrolase family protein [Methylomirabilota bacterium]|jgi:lysophospholipase L1-like esterase|nr:SGNH/GDSL hydrolase family protein [Methylomirabilota bacterium]